MTQQNQPSVKVMAADFAQAKRYALPKANSYNVNVSVE